MMCHGATWDTGMTLQHLQDFVAVVEQGSLRRAGQAKGKSEASLSKSIKRLEVALGTELLRRGVRGTSLTAAGQVLLARAQLILSEVELAQAEVPLGWQGQRTVSFGASPLAGLLLAPAALQEFRRRNSGVVVRCASGPYARLVSELLAGKLDFIVCPMLDGALDSSLDAKIISRHQSVIVARAGHPLRGATRLRDLVDCDWAVCGPLERGDASLAAMFRSVGMPRPNVAMICESFVDALAHVATSDLLSLCPPAGSAIEQGKVISISVVDQPPVQEVLLIRRRESILSGLAFTLYSIFEKSANNLAPLRS
jgi:DNA-binding transcriptional LysR family regulator